MENDKSHSKDDCISCTKLNVTDYQVFADYVKRNGCNENNFDIYRMANSRNRCVS